jgi:lipopolysaccharide export system permease protein
LTFHLRERRPNGLLLGIFLDDRRDPQERTTVLAEQGSILKNDKGTFLILEHGNVQRQEAGEREPNFVQFDRYAFDLSRFTGSAQILNMTAREKYITELASPDPDDPLLKSQPGQFRAEFHDRILAPVYPIAFIIITYAFLGAPRTNRQSRGFSMASAITGVAVLRLIGFGSSVIGARAPAALLVQYVALALAMGFGLYAIGRGAIIEPPALLMKALNAFARKFLPRPEPA